jgi:hypothetical protein
VPDLNEHGGEQLPRGESHAAGLRPDLEHHVESVSEQDRINSYGFGRAVLEVVTLGLVKKERRPTYDELVCGPGPSMTPEMRKRAEELSKQPPRSLPARPLQISDD